MNKAEPVTPADLLAIWPDYGPTPLIEAPRLAADLRVASVLLKLESHRPLGNFKALGGLIAGLKAIAQVSGRQSIADLLDRPVIAAPRLICASDGNHGLAVAAAAQRVGAQASVYLPAGTKASRIQRIEALGAEVVMVAGTYDAAVSRALSDATSGRGVLVPDTSQNIDDTVVANVMSGYAVMTAEIRQALHDSGEGAPTHQFIQAGVGGLAAAMAEGLADMRPAPPRLLVVESETAACVAYALRLGRPERITGDLESIADMLSCGLASAPALKVLQRHAARSIVVTEADLSVASRRLQADEGVVTTPSGAAGLAGLLTVSASAALRREHVLQADSRVLLVVTEGGEQAARA